MPQRFAYAKLSGSEGVGGEGLPSSRLPVFPSSRLPVSPSRDLPVLLSLLDGWRTLIVIVDGVPRVTERVVVKVIVNGVAA